MLIEITEEQRNNLLVILNDTTIKGSMWKIICELENALKNPIKDKPLQIVKEEQDVRCI